MGCHATHLYRLKNVLYYDPQSGSGFTVKRKRGMAFVTLLRYAKVAWKLKRKIRGHGSGLCVKQRRTLFQ